MKKLKHVLDKVNVNKLINIYIAMFISYLLITRVAIYIYITGSMINTIISSIFAAFGLVLLLMKFLRDYRFYMNKFNVLLFLFLIISIISSFINIKYGFISNFKMIMWMIIQYFLLFSSVNYSKEDFNDMIRKVGVSILSLMFICATISVVQFLLNINYQIPLFDYPRHQGFVNGRLYGLFDDPNYASIAAISALSFSLLFSANVKKSIYRIFLYINIFIQATYIILSNSRTGLICLFICVFVFAYYKATQIYYQRDFNIMKTFLCFTLIFILGAGLVVSLREAYTFIPNIIYKVEEIVFTDGNSSANNTSTETGKLENTKEEKNNILSRNDVNEDISNNRIDIWRGAIEVSKEKRLFGVSPRNLIAYAKDNYPYSYIAQTGYETHNGYLSLFVGSGYIGTVTMIAFAIFCFVNIAKQILKSKVSIQMACFMMVVCSIAFSTIMLQDVFYMNNATTVIFWWVLGVIIFNKEFLNSN